MFAIALLLSCFLLSQTRAPYQPTWDSIDKRPLPPWFDEAKIGIFLHWGVFSVPSFGSEWFWSNWQMTRNKDYVNFMDSNFKPNFSYPEFAPDFTAEFYDPDKWADLFQYSGAKYVVLTSKHHEGFTLWPSKVSWNWNAVDIGPRRDLLGDLAKSIRNRTDMVFGVYHSMFEWFHPLYLLDKKNNFKTRNFPNTKSNPELMELILNYKPEVVWSDGDWEAPDTYWQSQEFLAWLYNESPVKDTVVVNDRWGIGTPCKHGGYYSCQDRYNPKTLQLHKWENAMTFDKSSWGYRRNVDLSDFLTIQEIITTLAETVSCGGNLLMNVGPTKDGRIIPIFQERLRQLGDWLKVNGEGIYKTKPWIHQNDTVTPGVWYTTKDTNGISSVYTIVLNWPKDNKLTLGALQLATGAKVTMLGLKSPLSWTKDTSMNTIITFPMLSPNVLPSTYAWVLKTDVNSFLDSYNSMS